MIWTKSRENRYAEAYPLAEVSLGYLMDKAGEAPGQ